MGYLERHAEMLRYKNRPFEVIAGQIFVPRDHWIMPLGPVSQAYHLEPAQCRDLLRQLGGLWVQWTEGFGTQSAASEWYCLVCRRHVPVDEVPSANARKHIRRGLKRCEVRQVGVEEIARNGYETYCAALRGYGAPTRLPTAEEFARRVMTDEPFQDIRHQWAAYHEGKLIAFNQNLIYGDIEVDYTLGKYHPDYQDHYPAYALFNRMNEFYLAERKFQYVHAGSRSISHDTQIQDFLTRLFNFEKEPLGLYVHYRPLFGQLLKAVRPFRAVVAAACPKTTALFELDRLRAKP